MRTSRIAHVSLAPRCSRLCTPCCSSSEVHRLQIAHIHGFLTSTIRSGTKHHTHAFASSPKAIRQNELRCASVFRLATLGGAEAAHRSDIGSIEPGKLADIVLYDANSVNLAGCLDPFKGIVMHATAQDVSWVIVNGRVVKQEGRLLPVSVGAGQKWEWEDVAKQLRPAVKNVAEKLAKFDLAKRFDTVSKLLSVQLSK